MNKLKHIVALIGLAAVAAVTPAQTSNDNAVGEALPVHLRALLIQEMLAILEASKNIMDAMVRGQDERVAEHAQAVHDSFIMAQQMTDEDRETLHSVVPQAFLERDEAFHELSAALAAAARAGDRPRQRELFADMIEACVDCHAAHAANRFPELAREASQPQSGAIGEASQPPSMRPPLTGESIPIELAAWEVLQMMPRMVEASMPIPLSADGAETVRAYAARVSAETDERDRATMREALCSARSATLRGHELGRLLAQGEAESDARKADDVDGLRSVLSDDDYTRFMAFVAERRMNMRVHRSDHEALWASYSPEQVEEARERICAALTAAAPED